MSDYLKDLWKRIKADARNWYKSLTVVLNGIGASLLAVWMYLQQNPDALQQAMEILPQLADLLDPKVLSALTFGFNLLNIALRFKTDKPMRAK